MIIVDRVFELSDHRLKCVSLVSIVYFILQDNNSSSSCEATKCCSFLSQTFVIPAYYPK